MKVFASIYLIVGLLGVTVMSMLLAAQYELVTNGYSSANKDWGAKTIAWMIAGMSLAFVIGAIMVLRKKR